MFWMAQYILTKLSQCNCCYCPATWHKNTLSMRIYENMISVYFMFIFTTNNIDMRHSLIRKEVKILVLYMIWVKNVFFAPVEDIATWSLIARFLGQHGAQLGPVGPRWAPCCPHELCYLGYCIRSSNSTRNTRWVQCTLDISWSLFLWTHGRNPTAHPWGQDMLLFLWFQTPTKVWPFLLCSVQYPVIYPESIVLELTKSSIYEQFQCWQQSGPTTYLKHLLKVSYGVPLFSYLGKTGHVWGTVLCWQYFYVIFSFGWHI